ncbi:MAG: hypothetical protein M3Y87_10265 [Myxococcota bacterium]|nr:hypothetical protein [Myxococcota bacterium]
MLLRAPMVPHVSLLFALALCACEPSEPPPLPPATYTLDDRTTVDVDGRGAIILTSADGRRLAATAPGAAPTLRSFEDSVRETLGRFQFRRTGEVERALPRFLGSEGDASGVTLRFAGDGGATGTMTIRSDGASRTRIRFEASAEDLTARSIALPFACDEDATFLGFGEQYNAIDQRGEAFALYVEEQGIGRTGGPVAITGDAHTTYYPMPWWIDLRGSGVLIDTPSRTLVDLCARDPEVAWIEVESGAPIDAIVFHGPAPLDVIAQLGAEVGRPARPPDWALERLWIGIQGGQDAVLAEADALEAAGIPIAALWAQDWSGRREFTPGRFGVLYRWVPDTTLYPDIRAMTDDLHARGVRFFAYANPFVVPGVDHFEPMSSMGLLIGDPESEGPYLFNSVFTESSMPDFTNPAAYDYVERHLESMVVDLGIDGWMADFGEWLPVDAELASGADARDYHNLYPAAWHRASREVMDRARPDGDWVVFTRSGWTRQHEVAQVVWCGDQEADFSETDGLPTVVPCMLNLGLSGVPFVTHDVAGFSGGPSTKELYLRWVELGAFTPIFRTHEGLQREANWSWESDAETTAHVRRFARLHEALGPELRALADEAATSSAPMVRALSLVFPDDAGSRGVSDQFLLGNDLLIAPVVTAGAASRSVVLPPGTWHHVWSGTAHEGPAVIEVEAPIGQPPVFSRDRDRPELRAIE